MAEMDSRKRLVLKEIVDRYIKSGQPVSSQALLSDYGLSVSSATIRNDMKALEEAGYITKAYHSAGRVPTERGYRFFVDWLVELSELGHQEQHAITESYEFQHQEIGALLRQTALLLAKIGGYAGFVLSPRIEQTRLRSILLVRLDETNVLVAILSELGLIETRMVHSTLSEAELAETVALLNRRLRGQRLAEIRNEAIRFSETEGWSKGTVRQAFTLLREAIDRHAKRRLYTEGLVQLLQQMIAERCDLEEMQALAALSGDPARLAAYLYRQADNQTRALIGAENTLEALRRSSLVLQSYGFGGVLGLLGPVQMNYSKAFSVTQYVSNRLRAILTVAQRDSRAASASGGKLSDA
ncbi:MAG TPA: heat-inducible transcription repressor HrcA [Candidatus Fraserbacteria bacterium]|nr:heat-inducible transcription repressor HrcA [Candidatus Fraserbacteria bacterium]